MVAEPSFNEAGHHLHVSCDDAVQDEARSRPRASRQGAKSRLPRQDSRTDGVIYNRRCGLGSGTFSAGPKSLVVVGLRRRGGPTTPVAMGSYLLQVRATTRRQAAPSVRVDLRDREPLLCIMRDSRSGMARGI